MIPVAVIPLMFVVGCLYQGILNLIFLLTLGLLRPAIVLKPAKLHVASSSSSKKKKEKKVCIITGANTGIGFQTAKELAASKTFDVIILACRTESKGKEAARTIGGNTVFMQLDLGSFDSVRAFVTTFNAKYKSLDCLVNNAGILDTSITAEGKDLVFQTNFTAAFLLTNLLLPRIRACDGIVINLASVMHHFAQPHLTVQDWEKCIAGESKNSYADSKLAAVLFTIALRNHKDGPVRSMSVNPGAVFSDIWRNFSPSAQWFYKTIFLTTEQGGVTTLAAIAGDFGDSIYLSPYMSLPLFGALCDWFGIFVGHNTALKPSLPANPEKNAEAMCEAVAKECGL
jgi:NAD(P)-dependent dehydrogenase (short-subunit alcohol dehydrogenase family)